MNRILVMTLLLLGNLYADSFRITGSFLDMNYVERSQSGSFLDSEKSDFRDIVGIDLGYKVVVGDGDGGANESALAFSLGYLNGESAYDGSLQSKGSSVSTPYQSKTKMTIIEPKIRWEETTKGDAYDVGIFTSLGYRYWKRDLEGQYGYTEEYSWSYIDTGIKALFHDKNWHIGFEVAYIRAFQPKLYASLDSGTTFDLGITDGYYYKIPLLYDISKALSFELSYRFERWDIEASDRVNGYYEPQSKTKNKKISIGLVFKW